MKAINKRLWVGLLLVITACLFMSPSIAFSAIYNETIEGTDAIFLAGRDDVTIEPLDKDWRVEIMYSIPLTRHNFDLPFPDDFRVETFPKVIPVAEGDVVKVLDPGIGGVNFYNGFGIPGSLDPLESFFGPEGNIGPPYANLWDVFDKFEGISMFKGTQGPLTGVFLTDDNPMSNPGEPSALDYTLVANRNMVTYSPAIGEIFFIGDGVTDLGERQAFVAPTGATRLFLGIPDGFGFVEHPGAYEDNDGSYQIVLGVNETPVLEIPVSIDIKPGSCPNPVNVNSGGVVSVAILGKEDFDVTTIDPTSVMLAGVYPLLWSYEDVATPYEPFLGEDCYDCHELEGDGYTDNVFKFKKAEL